MEWKTDELNKHIQFIDYRGKTPTKAESGMRLITAKNVKMGFIQINPQEFVNPDIYDEWMIRGIPKKGDVLFTTEAPLGNVAQLDVDDRVVIGQRLITMQPDRTVIDPTFLKYAILSPQFQAEIHSRATGATVLGIKAKLLKQVPFTYPPISEQKRIVALLDTVFADLEQTRAKTEQNLKNARELFDSYLQQVFSQKGEGWVEKSIAELTTKLGDGLHGTPKYSDDGEYYFINGNNLNDGVIEFKERTKKVSEIEFDKYKKTLNDRTILVSINGTLGNVAFYNNEKVVLGKSACYFNLKEGINKEYVKFVIESQLFQNYAEKIATGATIKNVSLKSMRAFLVPMAPTHLQSEIVSELNQIKLSYISLDRIYKAKLTALDELKKSILQKAFSGELTHD